MDSKSHPKMIQDFILNSSVIYKTNSSPDSQDCFKTNYIHNIIAAYIYTVYKEYPHYYADMELKRVYIKEIK